MPCPLSLAEMASRRGLQILQFNPFSLRFASTYFTIINHPFRLPRAGAHCIPHFVRADDRDADYDVGGEEYLGEPVYLNPNTQKLTFENQ